MNQLVVFTAGVLLGILWLRLNRRLFDDFLSPFNLLLFSWVGPLTFKGMHLCTTERDWTWDFVLVITGLSFVLLAGALLPALLMRKLLWKDGELSLQLLRSDLYPNEHQVCRVALFFGCLVVFVYNDFLTNPAGIPFLTYWIEPETAREAYHRWGRVGVISSLAAPLWPLIPLLYLDARLQRSPLRKVVSYTLILIFAVLLALKMSRIEFLNAVSLIGFSEYYLRKLKSFHKSPLPRQKRLIRLALQACALLLLLFALGSAAALRSGLSSEARRMVRDDMGFSPGLPESTHDFLFECYGYFALPFQNFADFYMDYQGASNPGIGGLRWIFSISGLGEAAREREDSVDMYGYLRMWPSNTFTFAGMLYAEGGCWDVFAFAILYSLGTAWSYIAFRKRQNLGTLTSYIIISSYAWMWLFSCNGYQYLALYAYLFGVGIQVFASSTTRRQCEAGLPRPGALCSVRPAFTPRFE